MALGTERIELSEPATLDVLRGRDGAMNDGRSGEEHIACTEDATAVTVMPSSLAEVPRYFSIAAVPGGGEVRSTSRICSTESRS